MSGVSSREARVEMIDASGRRVATLQTASRSGGDTRTWTWGGADDAGRLLPGRYVVRVSARGEVRAGGR